MSSMTAIENAIDNIPLSMVLEKQPIMEKNMPVIEELEIDMGDYEYRHRNNFLRSHKIKMLDVMIDMKRQFPLQHYGRLYTHTGHLRFHPLFPYFHNKKTAKWVMTAPPTWFREKLEKSITEHPVFKDDEKLIELCMRLIDVWYINEGTGTPCGHKNWTWDTEIMKRLPCWDMKDLFNEMDKYQLWKGEWLFTHYSYMEHKEEYNYTQKIIKELTKKPDSDGYFNHREMRGYDGEVSKEQKEDYKKWETLTHYDKKYTLFSDLKTQFIRRISSTTNREEDKEIYSLKIRRLYQGDRMDYEADFIGSLHMLRWKKTMANGNCSNKDLKATHLYYRDKEYHSTYGRGGWIFEAVKIDDAIICAERNGFPKWGKKGNGKKKPTYREIKMWWYKLE